MHPPESSVGGFQLPPAKGQRGHTERLRGKREPRRETTEPVAGEKTWQEDDSLSDPFGSASPCMLPSGLSPGPVREERRGEEEGQCSPPVPAGLQAPVGSISTHRPVSPTSGCVLLPFLPHLSPVLLQTPAAPRLLSPLQSQGQSAGLASASELSLFCAEEPLGGPVSHQPWLLPGDVRGSFELISGEAAGFCVGGSRNSSARSQHPLGQGRTGKHGGL